jgi:hypothetical protein
MIVGFLLAMFFAPPAFAADSCTIAYRVDATLEVSDTQFKKGDVSVDGVRGSLVIEYPQGAQGQVVDGKVKVLHYAMYESFKIDTVVNITTTIHHFTPACNGSDEPTWRRASDKGFPAACRYTGNERPVAIGVLRKDDNAIEWGRCKAAPSYWAADRKGVQVGWPQRRGQPAVRRVDTAAHPWARGFRSLRDRLARPLDYQDAGLSKRWTPVL